MYERILVPTDGSPGSDQVADHAAELAATTGAELFAVYVVDEKALAGGEGRNTDLEEAFEDEGREVLEEVEAAGDAHGVPVDTELRHGVPHRTIVEYADEVGADAIVMGTHGRSGLERYLLGSVTEHVMRTARQPVLAVKLSGSAVTTVEEAEQAAERALEEDGRGLEELREEPYRERTTWVVPALTTDDRRVNVHVDAVTGDTRVAHLVE